VETLIRTSTGDESQTLDDRIRLVGRTTEAVEVLFN
jgi:hypothetical protein